MHVKTSVRHMVMTDIVFAVDDVPLALIVILYVTYACKLWILMLLFFLNNLFIC